MQIEEIVLSVQTKVQKDEVIYEKLSQYSTLYNTLFRKLYNVYSKNEIIDKNKLKRDYIKDNKIPGRMFESINIFTKGKISAKKELHKYYQSQYKTKTELIEKELKKKLSPQKKNKLKLKLHKLKSKLTHKINYKNIWGSLSFYKKQWNEEDKSAWKHEWNRKRNHTFTIVGSKDESNGNSLCQLVGSALRLTLPEPIRNDGVKYLSIPIKLESHKNTKYYQNLKDAIKNKVALTYQFTQKENGHWYINIIFKLKRQIVESNKAIGIDVNYDHIDTVQTDKNKNFISFKSYNFQSEDKSSDYITDILSHYAIDIVDRAIISNSHIIIEKLDLDNKRLADNGKVVNRKLHGIQYQKFFSLLRSRCIKNGIKLVEVNPAYTSIIGKYKYKDKYGLNSHVAASFVIARRGLGCRKERIPSNIDYTLHCGEADKWKLIRYKHLWSQWSFVQQNYINCLQKCKSMVDNNLSLDQSDNIVNHEESFASLHVDDIIS